MILFIDKIDITLSPMYGQLLIDMPWYIIMLCIISLIVYCNYYLILLIAINTINVYKLCCE